MNQELVSAVKASFAKNFGEMPLLVRAPGRINVIGEHTDYNMGFVLPAAVGQGTYFAMAKSNDKEACSLISLDLNDRYDFKLSEMAPLGQDSWQNYILGVVAEIQKAGGKLEGFNLVFSGDVPRGSGMSSSAALECGTCLGLNELFGLGFDKVSMVKMSQKAEHNYAGVMCGIMDQFASMMGKQDQVLLLDCKTLEYHHFPMVLENTTLMLCNSNVSHSLASSEYNTRRLQCNEGVSAIQKKYEGVESLRDVNMDQLNNCKSELSEVIYKRCKYVIEESERVHAIIAALKKGDIKQVGEILKVAQLAMAYEYEVTCPEIDFMADFANQRSDVLGARMMGGGFGGCTLNLIEKGKEKTFVAELDAAYKAKFNKNITPVEIVISDGAHVLEA
ncbi:MAG: galactokinase [Marinoscillum sp.]|jgi:galactokinase